MTTSNCASGTLTYRWYRVDGLVEMPLTDDLKYTGTGTLTVNILDALTADAGTYRLKVTCSETQCTGVADAVLSIGSPVVSATGAAVCAGNTAHLVGLVTTENCAAGSTLTYKWYRVDGLVETPLTDDLKYTGTDTLTLNILNAVAADAGTYRLKVTCSGTQCTGVADAILSVNQSPVVSATGAAVCAGNAAHLVGSVTTSNCAAGTLTYKWYRVDGLVEMPLTDDLKYTGTDTLTLNILNAVAADAGTYRLKATCSGTQCTGVADAVLSITSPVVSATGTVVCAGNTAHLVGSVTTSNCAAGTLTYKWYRVDGLVETPLTDDLKYTGTGTLTLNILDALAADAGTYRLKVTCSETQCTGVAEAVLSIGSPVVSATDAAVCAGNTAYLVGSVTTENCAAGSTLTYKWYRVDGLAETLLTNDLKYTGTDTLTLNILNAVAADAGTYRLKVTCSGTQCTGVADAVLSVGSLVVSATDATVCAGNIAHLVGSVMTSNCAAGSTLTYKWYRVEGSSETSLTDGSKYTDTSTITLNILNAVLADAGTYRLKATCSGTQCTGVAEAVLSVSPSPVVSAIGSAVCAGNTAHLVGSVTTGNCAAGTLTYKWYRVEAASEISLTDDLKYTGTDTFTLNILDAVPADAGTYRLKVTCSETQCTGVAEAVLSIGSPVVSATDAAVCEGNTAHLVGSVTTGNCAAGTLTYKWYRVELPSETSLTDSSKYTGTGTNMLNILNAVPADAGTYRLRATCSGTQCTGVAEAVLSVNKCGSITLIETPIGGDGTFGFTGTGFPDGSPLNSPSLGPDAYSTERIGLLAGKDYIICQTSMPPYWSLVNIVVEVIEGTANVQYGSDDNWHETFDDITGDKCVKVHIDPGANVKVTFINQKQKSEGEKPAIILELNLTKTALNTSVHRGEDIYYEIKVCNSGSGDLTNVTVWDVLPQGVELITTYPETGSSLSWDIGTLPPNSCSLVRVVVRVPITDINYDMTQGVQGTGFVNVHNDYDTHQGPESVTNCAYAKADLVETVSSCASTGIVDPRTELKRREFGSGTYESEELTRIRTENKSIKTVTNLSAVHQPTTFSLPQGRSINYGTKWTEKSKGSNTITGASMNEEYTSATKINKERSVELDKNGSIMTTEVEFEGQGHIGVLKKESPDSHPKVKTIFESREDYAGNFKIYEKVDEYGTSVVSNKSTSGFGYVAVDKKIRDSQRTYESGTGSYQSEELIDTPTSYMAKNISLVHAPASYSYSPSFRADQDMKWSEGMWSKSGGLCGGNLITDIGPSRQLAASSCLANGTSPGTLISEKYSYLDNLQKETVLSGLNEMKTEASFSGMADYRVLSHGTNGTDVVDNEERYVGSYDINRHVLLTGTSKYDIPHLTVIKEGRIKNEWYNKTNATQAEYTITITNDGNRALAPIYVRDLFPAGTQYVKSTIRPASLTASEVNWTLIHLGIGNTITIGLTLNVTEGAPGNNLVNRVVACGMSGDKSVCAGNYSSLEFGWLTCCPPEVLVSKKAWLDEADPTVVHYRIIVDNKAPDSVAVTVTDQLTGGMKLMGASVVPNSYDANQIVWALPEIKPGRYEIIDYAARVLRDGGYTSTVHIDATAINGTGYDTMDAAAYIEVTRTGVAPKTFRYGSWEPPAWNLSAPEPGLNTDPELELDVESGIEG